MGRLPRNDKMNKSLGHYLSTASLRVIKSPFGDVSERVHEKLMAGGLTPSQRIRKGVGVDTYWGPSRNVSGGVGCSIFLPLSSSWLTPIIKKRSKQDSSVKCNEYSELMQEAEMALDTKHRKGPSGISRFARMGTNKYRLSIWRSIIQP